MPIEESDDLEYQGPEPPGIVERLLRRIFVEDFKLKLLSLGITLVLWFGVTGQQRPKTKRLLGVQLSFIHSENMDISNDPPSKVDITVTGRQDELEQVNPLSLLATVLVGDQAIGNRVIRLSNDVVKIDQLPSTVTIEGFQPATVSVRMEPRIERMVDIDLKFEGKLPDGYEVYSASSNPPKVRVRGPASIVNSLEHGFTESILLDGKTSSFDLGQVAVDIPNQKVAVVDGVVQVHVEVGERAAERAFNNVTVQSSDGRKLQSQMAVLTVSAPAAILAQLRPEQIRLMVDGLGAENKFRLELPASIQGKVKIVSVNPAHFQPARP
jgi:YbbR domain-containing protein